MGTVLEGGEGGVSDAERRGRGNRGDVSGAKRKERGEYEDFF